MPLAIVIGVGPKLGSAVARRFAREGLTTGVFSRTIEFAKKLKGEVESEKIQVYSADASSPSSLSASIKQFLSDFAGQRLEVVVYNAAAGFPPGPFLDITLENLERSLDVNVKGAWTTAKEVFPVFLSQQPLPEAPHHRGTYLITGATAMLRGSARFSSFASGNFGKRALAQSLAREFGPQGIHVADVIIDGGIGPEGSTDATKNLDPDAIADTYWHLHKQHASAWTYEVDLRPFTEKF
ncbi:NAD(P)-binding protein [Gonapodya prolifera JEL478]|uniref:NAD(P)-binding protein n=1 Tax=Gonapodya prolifera (strain JEL478) TaxID=1344416 RepID=A0A139AJT2_GONPJ|nr:NAD(P)-binding protein [Gonapodya prolifera JEL478]|eukprot:KXS17066.1 NAD(P)-binding protein [Gonapodya prolifera JEL478]